MLTNLGSQPAVNMHETLTMLVPGGFTFDVSDLEALLTDMAKRGEVQQDGMIWKATMQDD